MKTLVIEISKTYLGFTRLKTGLFPGWNLGFVRLSYAFDGFEAALLARVKSARTAAQ